jgi:hypothetical protein
MEANAIERVAHDEPVIHDGVVKGNNAKMVAGAEERIASAIPYREGEVAEQSLRARLAPDMVGMKNELRVGGAGLDRPARALQRADKLGSSIESCVRRDPDLTVQGTGLWLAR